MYLQSIKSVKHNAAKSINRSIVKKSRHLGFVVSIVHSSMPNPLTLSLASPQMRRLPPSLQPTSDKISACLPPLIHALSILSRRECFRCRRHDINTEGLTINMSLSRLDSQWESSARDKFGNFWILHNNLTEFSYKKILGWNVIIWS